MPVHNVSALADMMAGPAAERPRRGWDRLTDVLQEPPQMPLPPPPEEEAAAPGFGIPGQVSMARGSGGGWGGGVDPLGAFVNGVPTDSFMDTIMMIESGGNPNAYNASSGATGAYQIIPKYGADPGYGVAPIDLAGIKDPTRAREWAKDYLSAMYRKFGTPQLAAAAYNAGPGTIENVMAGRASMPAETQGYIGKAFGQ